MRVGVIHSWRGKTGASLSGVCCQQWLSQLWHRCSKQHSMVCTLTTTTETGSIVTWVAVAQRLDREYHLEKSLNAQGCYFFGKRSRKEWGGCDGTGEKETEGERRGREKEHVRDVCIHMVGCHEHLWFSRGFRLLCPQPVCTIKVRGLEA